MSGNLRLYGTSGYVELQAPANAVSQTLVLPTDSIQPALVHINTTTVTAVTSVSFNDLFTSDYDNYLINITGSTSGNEYMTIRMRLSGVDNSASSYNHQALQLENTSVSSYRSTTTLMRLGYWTASDQNGSSVQMFNPAKAVPTTTICQSTRGGTSQVLNLFNNFHNVATAYDGMTILCSGTLTGTIRVYAYSNGA